MQRILASHNSISTTAEPWLLLPLLYSIKDHGIYTEYRQATASPAIREFIQEMPNGNQDFYRELRQFVLKLYELASREEVKYFLDKTPRYHLVADEIINLFPNGKFIFLWRNPLAIISSLIESYKGGRWNLYLFQIDLYEGLENLIATYLARQSHVLALRYEDLLSDPDTTCQKIFSYLELPFSEDVIINFSKLKMVGKRGDQIGINKYNTIDKEPLEKWKNVLSNPFRKHWSRRYLKWVGRERFQSMGYDFDQLLEELDSIPVSYQYMFQDIIWFTWGLGYRFLEPRIAKHKIQEYPYGYRIHAHT